MQRSRFSVSRGCPESALSVRTQQLLTDHTVRSTAWTNVLRDEVVFKGVQCQRKRRVVSGWFCLSRTLGVLWNWCGQKETILEDMFYNILISNYE